MKMAKKIEIAAFSGFTMAGSWDQRLFCTICADGTVSLRAELRGDTPTDRPKGARGIRTAQQFMDGISKATEMSSLADHIDYEQVCAALAPSCPRLADDLARLVNGDTEPELPKEIEKAIRMILASKEIYPSTCRTLVDRRIRHDRTRKVLVDHYLSYGRLHVGPIVVDGHQIAPQEFEPYKED
jgi:hypothetical protein